LIVDDTGLVTIGGGKWTTYRKMGEDTVTVAARLAGLQDRPSVTAGLRIHGWCEGKGKDNPLQSYGSDARQLERMLDENSSWREPLHPSFPYRVGEVIWAVRREWARTVEDVLARRTRALLLDARASMAVAPRVAELMAAELGRDRAWQEGQVSAYRDLVSRYLP
jgi:glycerol-3-phosphate dehydrogenase